MKILIAFLGVLTSFHALAQGDSVVLKFRAATLSNDSIYISTFKAYISQIEIQFEDGKTYKEPESYHLIDFLSDETSNVILYVPHEKSITSLSYSLGTDSLTNVSGVYDGDLDPIYGMYWAWNSGYINFKLEGSKNQTEFAYHIGGYSTPYPTAIPITHGFSNWSTDSLIVEFDVMKFINSIDLEASPKVMSPGAKAFKLAELAGKIISIGE